MYICVSETPSSKKRKGFSSIEKTWVSIEVHHIIPNEQRVTRKYEDSSKGDLVSIHHHFFYLPVVGESMQSFASPSILKIFKSFRNESSSKSTALYMSQQSIWNSVSQLSAQKSSGC